MRFFFLFAFLLSACIPVDPAVDCETDGIDYCARLLGTCATIEAFEAHACRQIVAENDWCACKAKLEELNVSQ